MLKMNRDFINESFTVEHNLLASFCHGREKAFYSGGEPLCENLDSMHLKLCPSFHYS